MRRSILALTLLLLAGQTQARDAQVTITYSALDLRSGSSLSETGSVVVQPGGNISLQAGTVQLTNNNAISGGTLTFAHSGQIAISDSQTVEPLTLITTTGDIFLAVPEPESWATLLAGLGLLALRRRKQP